MSRRFDSNLLVIGAGSAGLVAALIGAAVRARVTLIERAEMGGDCLNTGCVPSKTLIASAKAAHGIVDAERYGIRGAAGEVDFAAVMRRVRAAIATIAPKDSVERYTSLGVDCLTGDARIVDEHTVEVDGETCSARRIILAMGAEPFVPPIPGIDAVQVLTSENLWSLEQLPQRLLVLGGGPIGCELAQAFARLGSEVAIVDMEDRLLPREDREASAVVNDAFEREGIGVCTGHRAVRFDANTLVAEHEGVTRSMPFDRVIVAVGRRARGGAGLAEAGIVLQRDGTVAVNDYLQTSINTMYACGDLVGPYQFTHMAAHQAWYAAVNALAAPFWRFKADYSVVPWATYTDPEVGRVGLSEEDASAKGLDVEVTRYPLDDLDRAIADGQTQGFVKIISRGDKVLGATIVGAGAGELISEFVTAMTHGIGLKKILSTIHVYPTRMEAAKLAAGTWRRANAPQRVLSLAERVFRFQRGG